METYLNELSVHEDVFDDYKNIRNIADAYMALKQNGFSICYISSRDYNTIVNMLNRDMTKRNLLSFVYSFFHAPYEDSDKVEQQSEEYLEHEWNYKGKACFGLAMSYIIDTLSISLDSEIWKETVEINRDENVVEVRNVADFKHMEYHMEWLESIRDVTLLPTDIEWERKKIHLRDDHGKDVLQDFSKRIIRNSYVVSVINSIEFHPHYKKLIYDVKSNGVVELVLFWTDEGYGVAVQTTGRNRRETEKIARIIAEEYG